VDRHQTIDASDTSPIRLLGVCPSAERYDVGTRSYGESFETVLGMKTAENELGDYRVHPSCSRLLTVTPNHRNSVDRCTILRAETPTQRATASGRRTPLNR
jgi:hypothetical protein